MRRPETAKLSFKKFTPEQLARAFARQRQSEADARAKSKLAKALKGFKARKGERGKVVFISKEGKRIAGGTGRVGFAIYVDRKGKRLPVRQYDRKSARIERVPQARKLADIDISRVRSKRAKKQFLEAHTNEISRGTTIEKSRYGFRRNFRRIDIESDFARFASQEFLRILRSQRATDRNFALEIGINVKTVEGLQFIETRIDTLPGDLRKAKIESISVERLRNFFGHQVYSFIASELSSRGYVLAGSANFVRRLKENTGKKRDKWTKGGHIWSGIGKDEVEIQAVEWRFLQLSFTKI